MEKLIFYEIPISVLFLGTIALSVASIEVGRRVGLRLNKENKGSSGSVGSTVGSTLGLLAFILAFTFGVASSRYDARKQLVIDGANAIGTCYLRTEFLPDDQGEEARRLLREWLALRVEPDNFKGDQLRVTLNRAKEIQAELWGVVVAVSKTQPSRMTALFADSCNEVFDIHAARVTTGLVTRIPGPLWIVLYIVSMIAMVAVGYQSGADGSRRRVGTAFLALAFATVLVTIADLDDSNRGFLRIRQYPMEQLHQELDRE